MGQQRTDQHAIKLLLVGFNYADQHATNLLLVYVTLQTSLYTLFVAWYVVHIRYDFISLPLYHVSSIIHFRTLNVCHWHTEKWRSLIV